MPDAPCLFRSICYEVLTWHIIPHAAFLYNPENLLSYGGALKPDPSPMEKAGLSIPGEAAILGVDNDAALCENASPTLSSIRLDHEGLGYSAAKSLDVLMSSKNVRPNEELPPLDVIVRNSTIYLPPSRLLVDRAMRIIEDQGTKQIRITDIARQLNVSTSLLKLRFRQSRNRSMRDTLITSRLEKVTHLLKTRNYPIGQIAKMCGFSSSVVLNHLFRKKFGTSPGKWRISEQGTTRHN